MEGYLFSKMNLAENEVMELSDFLKPKMEGRELVIKELENKYSYASFDAQDTRISEILETTYLDVTSAKLLKYRKYLIENLKEPVYLTGVEDFPWEERFVFGYGSQQEYAQLRRTRPSYKDTFKLKKILETDKIEGDLLAKVIRKSDRKAFEIPLSELIKHRN